MYTEIRKITGFTLVEMLVSLSLTVVVILLVFQLFTLLHTSYIQITNAINSSTNARYPLIILERQILNSDKLFIKDNNLYFQDIETPKMYNYYSYKNGKIYKHKVNSNLSAIGRGSVSQFADNIEGFSINVVDDRLISINIVSSIEGKVVKDYRLLNIGIDIVKFEELENEE